MESFWPHGGERNGPVAKIVRDHHRKIKKVAIITNSFLGETAEHITSHFVTAEIRHFMYGHLDEVKAWVASD